MSASFLLDESNARLTMFPIQCSDIWHLYKKQMACFWTAEQVDFSQDKFHELDSKQQHFVKHILAFFAASDGLVNMNLLERFTREVQVMEVQVAYQFQAAMENIHSEVYSIMLETYITDRVERHYLFNALDTIPCIQKKGAWAFKWIRGEEDYSKRLLAFAVVEGVFFSGAFCAIYWLKQKNLLPGLTLSNEWISRDEGMHTELACLLYNKYIDTKLPETEVHELFRDAVEIEAEFITDSIPCSMIGMNSKLMTQYIQFIADKLLVDLNYSKLYRVENPFDFMENQSLETKTNFFENRVSSYQRAAVMNKSSGAEAFIEAHDF